VHLVCRLLYRTMQGLKPAMAISFLDLLSDYHNKYNKDEFIDVRHVMEGTEREYEEEETDDAEQTA
jgi:hypothetical protein